MLTATHYDSVYARRMGGFCISGRDTGACRNQLHITSFTHIIFHCFGILTLFFNALVYSCTNMLKVYGLSRHISFMYFYRKSNSPCGATTIAVGVNLSVPAAPIIWIIWYSSNPIQWMPTNNDANKILTTTRPIVSSDKHLIAGHHCAAALESKQTCSNLII